MLAPPQCDRIPASSPFPSRPCPPHVAHLIPQALYEISGLLRSSGAVLAWAGCCGGPRSWVGFTCGFGVHLWASKAAWVIFT